MSSPHPASIRIALLAALAGLGLAAPLHASAPRLDGRPLVRAVRSPSAPAAARFTPGQPARFPRELLPKLYSDFESAVVEPDDAGRAPARGIGTMPARAQRPVSGTNRVSRSLMRKVSVFLM